MLVSAESQVPKLISREIIFLRNSNACDHNPPTLQTDGQRDRQLIMAIPRYATLRAVKTLSCSASLNQHKVFTAVV